MAFAVSLAAWYCSVRFLPKALPPKATTMRWDMVIPAFLKWKYPDCRENRSPGHGIRSMSGAWLLTRSLYQEYSKMQENFSFQMSTG